MSRTKKQPYRKSRAVDPSCRCHGGCPWCLENRMHGGRRRLPADIKDQLRDVSRQELKKGETC